MGASSKKNATKQQGGDQGKNQPGQTAVDCKLPKPVPVLAQTITPAITVVDAEGWFHPTIETDKDNVGTVTLRATKAGDNLGYKEAGQLSADNGNCKFFTDKACKKPIDPAAGPVPFKFGSLESGVTLYYKGTAAGTTTLTLTMDAAKDARITVQAPVTGAVEAKEATVITPKVEFEYKLVLFDTKLYDKQAGTEVKIKPTPVYLEASAAHTEPAKDCTSTGKLSFAPARVEAFLDAECSQALDRELTADELKAVPPTKVWLRGKTEGKFKVKLTLSDPKDASIRRDKNPTDEEELGVVKLVLKLHQHDPKKLKSVSVNPDTNTDAEYHTALKDKVLPDQKLMKDAAKLGTPSADDAASPGRLLHTQNAGHAGRAKIIVGKIKAAHVPDDADAYEVALLVGRGWAASSGALKTEDLQGGALDAPTSGALAFFDAEVDGTQKNPPKYTIAQLKADDQTVWVEGTSETDGACDLRVDAGLDRAAGGLAKTAKRNGDWARFTVVKVEEIKLDHQPAGGQPDPWDAALKEYAINFKADPDGRKIKLEAKLTKPLKNVPLHFMLAPNKDNRKAANWELDLPAAWSWKKITKKVKHKDKKKHKGLMHLSEKTDASGKAKKEVELSRFGGDKYVPGAYITQDPHLAKYVHGHADLEKRKPVLATDHIIVVRKFWHQLIQVPGVNPPGLQPAIDQYQRVKARMAAAAPLQVNPAPVGSIYPMFMVRLNGGNGNALVVSNLNKGAFFTGLTVDADKPIKVPILICDAQWDAGVQTKSISSGWINPGVLTVTTDRLVLKPALGGGALLVSGTIQCSAPDGAGGTTAGPTVNISEADLSIDPARTSLKAASLAMPAAVTNWCNNHAGAQVKIGNLVMNGAKGPYLGESFDKKVLAVYDPTNAVDFQNTIVHEIGHGFRQTLKSGKQPSGAPKLPTQYNSYDSDGMGTGSHCNHATNKCVMYESGPIVGSYNRYCDDCHPYLLSLDMFEYS